MDIFHIDRTYRNIQRYRQIVSVFIKYGFGGLLEQLNLDYYLALGKSLITLQRIKRDDLIRFSKGERLRLALEELGPTFVKLGQLLSTRPDMVSPEILSELRKLQDKVPGFPFSEVRKQIESSMGIPLEEAFSEFSQEPVAAASISQVHCARLFDGTLVAVKVQRPEIEELIATDIDIMFTMAELATKHISELEPYQPTLLVREFAKNIRLELDFHVEGRNIDRFAKNFAKDPTVHIPTVYWKQSYSKVLTLEWIDGTKVDELLKSGELDYDPTILAAHGADFILRQILEFGLFHGDPHPGNLFILPGNVIAPIDFGLVGRLDDELATALLDLLLSVLKQDVQGLLRVLFKIGVVDEEKVNLRELRADLFDFMDRYVGVSLKDLRLQNLVQDFIRIINYHQIRFLPDFMLLLRVLISVEATARNLDPSFDFFNHSAPLVQELAEKRFSPEYLQKIVSSRFQEISSLLEIVPGATRDILKKLSRGHLRFEFEHLGLNLFSKNLDRIANRISFTMVISAIIIASSLIMSADNGFKVFDYPLLGIIGYVMAGGLGTWLAIAILRSGKM
ncbi:MAG: ubiquinone biosynthesis protein UbiB [Deltaproteobacteria bacterium]|nr:ubiquinone biosynthesis protein UbiB [Candidatus Tharpella aukensis]